MTELQKKLLFRIALTMPFMWWGLTLVAMCITWWHGYGAYFVYAALLVFLIATPCTLKNYKTFYLFNVVAALIAILFNFIALIFLFFPQWNGWGQWNADGGLVKVYFSLPSDFDYWTIGLFAVIFIFFAIKKFFEIDYNKMEKEAFKDKVVDKVDNQLFLNKGLNMIATLSFDVKFLAKFEYWLYTIGFIILCIVVLPARGLGSSMVAFGNNPFIATLFFVMGYLMVWLMYWMALTMYAQYHLINKIEKKLGVKLQPALRAKNDNAN